VPMTKLPINRAVGTNGRDMGLFCNGQVGTSTSAERDGR
jgi:hypothetical protein